MEHGRKQRGGTGYICTLSQAAFFTVLIPPRFQMLKLSLCGATGQSVIEKFLGVFLAQTVTCPVGTDVIFFFFPSSSAS